MTSNETGFARLIGTWNTRGMVIENGEQGAKIIGTDRYEMLGERFVVHTADVSLDGRQQRTVEIFTVDSTRFEALAYTDDGSTETVTGFFDDDGTYRAGNDTTRVALRIQPHTMDALWEIQRDGQWEPWIRLTFTRADAVAFVRTKNQPAVVVADIERPTKGVLG